MTLCNLRTGARVTYCVRRLETPLNFRSSFRFLISFPTVDSLAWTLIVRCVFTALVSTPFLSFSQSHQRPDVIVFRKLLSECISSLS